MKSYDVVVLGAGPAGLAAAITSNENGSKTLVIERENKPGGILKQCIHDGFGVVRFGQRLSGPEYAYKFIKEAKEKNVEMSFSSFVTKIKKSGEKFELELVNSMGMEKVKTKSIVLATGCRERTAKQVFIHGSRPAGVYTAGTAQYFTNIMGYLPGKECAVLGSGDIGLIMARRLTLEGAKVIGVYEAKPEPSGLKRNLIQCLDDYSIPLYLSHTITKIFGDERVEAVEISEVDKGMKPIKGTEKIVKCDTVILSVGLIPENEVAESLGLKMDPSTKGPLVDQDLMSVNMGGVFSCGNSLHVNDLVDYVSESGEIAGLGASRYTPVRKTHLIPLNKGKNLLYLVPQMINVKSKNKKVILYFRVKSTTKNAEFMAKLGNREILKRRYLYLRPAEMKRIVFDLPSDLSDDSELSFEVWEVNRERDHMHSVSQRMRVKNR